MKISLFMRDLISMYAAQTNLTKEETEIFIREFFILIEETLERDNYVKIKNFGTFKVVEGDTRQVLFVPDTLFADIVNEPFSFFEPVVLEVSENELDAVETPEEESTPDTEEFFEGEDVDTQQTPEPDVTAEETARQDVVTKPVTVPEQKKRKIPVYRYVFYFMMIVFLGGLSVLSVKYYTLMSFRQEVRDDASVSANEDKTYDYHEINVINDTVSCVLKADSVISSEVPDTSDIIAVHKLKQGESIAFLAKKYYGDSNLWTVIVKRNSGVVKNPDIVPPGTLLEIPRIRNNNDNYGN